jgi:hypothetical protein
MKKTVKIQYVLDNDNWTEKQFNKAQDCDNTFVITEEMIIDLINQNCNLEDGDFVCSINVRSF